MSSKVTHDVVATIGTYKDRDNNDKKRYLNVGIALTDDQDRISIKLDAIPLNRDWSGYLNLYPKKQNQPQ